MAGRTTDGEAALGMERGAAGSGFFGRVETETGTRVFTTTAEVIEADGPDSAAKVEGLLVPVAGCYFFGC